MNFQLKQKSLNDCTGLNDKYRLWILECRLYMFRGNQYHHCYHHYLNKQRVIKQRVREVFSYPNIRNVSLTYLKGLEIAELKEEDMPMV